MYGKRLRAIASRFLGSGRRIEDSEGIANAAFLSLVKQIGADDAEDHRDFEGLWPLAIGIARNKSREANRTGVTQKRGGLVKSTGTDGVADLTAKEPALFAELEELMERLNKYTSETPLVRQIVERRLEGLSSKDIAGILRVSAATVSRRLAELRRFLTEC